MQRLSRLQYLYAFSVLLPGLMLLSYLFPNHTSTAWTVAHVVLLTTLLVTWLILLPRQWRQPLRQVQTQAKALAEGNYQTVAPVNSIHVLSELSAQLDATAAHLREVSEFAQAIGEGKLDRAFTPAGESDHLGQVLLRMRNQLAEAAEENRQRNWTSEGLAQFAGILRSSQEIKVLGEEIIRACVRYVGACQGGIFLVNDTKPDDLYLELIGCYAYERKKFLQKRVDIGEGLLGQAYLEREPVFLTDVPPHYVHITSGLGEATPRCLLLMPIQTHEQVLGVLELASFTPLAPYQVAFVEKLAHELAAVIANVKINDRTRQLLRESQAQSEQLRQQEETLRQNMEELTAIQDELLRKQIELDGQINALNNAAIVSEVDLRGYITFANDEFCRVSKYRREELVGQKQSIVRHPDVPAAVFEDLWATITRGKVWKGEVKNRAKDGTPYWVAATITPVLGEHGKPVKYIGVRFDITAQKERQAAAGEELIPA